MAIVLGASPAFSTLRLVLEDSLKAQVTKQTLFDPDLVDDDIKAFVDAFDAVSNARIVKGRWNNRVITLQKADALFVQYPGINTCGVLTFSRVSPENGEITLWKEFVIPAPIATLFASDHITFITPAGAGADAAGWLNTIVTRLIASMMTYIKSADAYVIGDWTYVPSKSGLVGASVSFR